MLIFIETVLIHTFNRVDNNSPYTMNSSSVANLYFLIWLLQNDLFVWFYFEFPQNKIVYKLSNFIPQLDIYNIIGEAI